MSAPRRITSEDLALFAMQLLSKQESAEVAAYLDESEEARLELAQIQGDLSIYAHTVDLHSPPAQARERLMKQVAREKKAVPIDRPAANRVPLVYGNEKDDDDAGRTLGRRTGFGGGSSVMEDDLPRRSAAGKVFPWIGWAVAAGLAVAAGNLYHQRDALQTTALNQATRLDHLTADAAAARQVLDAMTDDTAMRVTLTKGQTAPTPQGRATYVADKGTLIFLANNLEPLEADKTYELWLIPSTPNGSPIPAGTFHPDVRGNASVILPPLPKGVPAKAFGVTIEDSGGATTPTLPIILIGT
jgi:Anti-sigma-K factor rskA